MLARPCLLARETGENFLRGLGLLRQHELQVVAERSFDGDDVFIRHANFVRERTENGLAIA